MMILLQRKEYTTNNEYFYHLYNDLGYSQLCIAYVNTDGRWSNWFLYEDLIHKNPNESIFVLGESMTVVEFIEKANNRTILDIEIMIDIDDVDGKTDPASIKQKAKEIASKLRFHGIKFEAFFSGSKSYHMSILVPELREAQLAEQKKREFKKYIIQLCGADLLKCSSRTMIALEGVPHWKTGRMKKELRL